MVKDGHNLRFNMVVYVNSFQLSYTLPSIILTECLEHKCTEVSAFSLTHTPQNQLRNVTLTASTDDNIGAKSPNTTGARMPESTDHLLRV